MIGIPPEKPIATCVHAQEARGWVARVLQAAEAKHEGRAMMQDVPAGMVCAVKWAADFAGWDAVIHYIGNPTLRAVELVKRREPGGGAEI